MYISLLKYIKKLIDDFVRIIFLIHIELTKHGFILHDKLYDSYNKKEALKSMCCSQVYQQ